jgi:DNA-binding NarL/FixJ family response regulator
VIRVVIADDHALVRAGFAAILTVSDDIDVVGEAVDGLSVLSLVRELRPDVVLMDVHMPHLDGIAATAEIVRHGLARVLILTTFDVDQYVFDALRVGASGFILKDGEAESLAPAIRGVHSGQSVLAPAVVRRLLERHATTPDPSDPRKEAALARLTTREADTLAALAAGLSNAEIAQRLDVGEATVKTYVSSVLLKLGLRDRLQAVVFAYECGLATPGTATPLS